MNNTEPYIFVIDLDGTIIGNCTYQCDIYNIMELIKNSKKKDLNKYKILCDKSLNDSYNNKSLLIRPYFFYFVESMKKLYPESYFYIYTASEKKWAIKEISIIEKNNNFKFDRPFFTRDNCIIDNNGNIKKSITKILPLIKKNVKMHASYDIKKHLLIIDNNGNIKKSITKILPLIKKNVKMHASYDIKKHLLIIDNNPTFIDYKDNLLLCPTYNYIKFNNLKDVVPYEINCNNIKNYVTRLTKEQRICRNYDTQECSEKMYKWLYKKCKKINKYNMRYLNDNFWKDLVILIKNYSIKHYTAKNVEIMQKSIKI